MKRAVLISYTHTINPLCVVSWATNGRVRSVSEDFSFPVSQVLLSSYRQHRGHGVEKVSN